MLQMSLAITDFRGGGNEDPFLSGFERLERKATGDIPAHVCAREYGRLFKTRERICSISSYYFPAPSDLGAPDQRAGALSIGMLIGLYAGLLSMPRLARPHYLEQLQGVINFDGSEFRGYHADTSSLETGIDRRYMDKDLQSRLPRCGYAFLDEHLQVGFGWLATKTADYHSETLSVFSARSLWRSRNFHRKSLKEDLNRLQLPGVLTLPDAPAEE